MSIMPIGFTPGIVGAAIPAGMPAAMPAGMPALPDLPGVGAPDRGFGNMLTQGIERLDGLHDTSDKLAVQAATGDLKDVHDYMIASSESSVATEMTVAVRNKAVEAFTEIMRMQV